MTVNKKTDGMGATIAVVGLATALKLAKLAVATVLHDDPDKGVTFETYRQPEEEKEFQKKFGLGEDVRAGWKLSPEELAEIVKILDKKTGCVKRLENAGLKPKAAGAICGELHPEDDPPIILPPIVMEPQTRGPFDGIIDMLKIATEVYGADNCVTRSIISGLEVVNGFFKPENVDIEYM